MSLAPETYLRARKLARFHVQVKLEDARLPSSYPGEARIIAIVVRLFRGNEGLAVGDRVTFDLCVVQHMDQIPTSGEWWTLAARVSAGQLMEAFLDGEPPDCKLAHWQSMLIDADSAEPQMKLDSLYM